MPHALNNRILAMPKTSTVRLSRSVKVAIDIHAAARQIPLRDLLDEIGTEWLKRQPAIITPQLSSIK